MVAKDAHMKKQTEQLVKLKADFFKALASPMRIRILGELRNAEMTVTALRLKLNVEPTSVSQQLAVLRARNIVVCSKQGSRIYYACSDQTIFKLLDSAKEIYNNHLVHVSGMLEAL